VDLAAAGSFGYFSASCQAVAAVDRRVGGLAVALAGIVAARQGAALEASAVVETLAAVVLEEVGEK